MTIPDESKNRGEIVAGLCEAGLLIRPRTGLAEASYKDQETNSVGCKTQKNGVSGHSA